MTPEEGDLEPWGVSLPLSFSCEGRPADGPAVRGPLRRMSASPTSAQRNLSPQCVSGLSRSTSDGLGGTPGWSVGRGRTGQSEGHPLRSDRESEAERLCSEQSGDRGCSPRSPIFRSRARTLRVSSAVCLTPLLHSWLGSGRTGPGTPQLGVIDASQLQQARRELLTGGGPRGDT